MKEYGRDNDIETIGQTLGIVVAILQKIKGVKNKDFNKYGVSSSQLSQIKAGTQSPSVDKLFQLSKGLDVPVSTIMRFVEDQQNNKRSKMILMSRICQQIDELEQKEKEYQKELMELNSL